MTQGALSQIEIGSVVSVKAETLVRLAVALGANPQWIQTGRGSPVAEALETVDESEAIALFRSLKPANRSAWLAAGRALLDAQGENNVAHPYPAASGRAKSRP